jgi:hypothetical protein
LCGPCNDATDSILSCRFSSNFPGGCVGRRTTLRRLSVLSVSDPTHCRNSNVPNQGPPRGEYSGSHRDYHDALRGGTTHTSYGVSHGSMHLQALHDQSSSLQPGTPAGYDTAPHASQQPEAPPPIGPRPPTEFVPIDSAQSGDSPYPLGFVNQQVPRQLNLASSSSEGSAGAWDLLAGSYSDQSTSESHSPYSPGGFRLDCQPSQSPPGVQDAGVPFSQVYLNFPFFAPASY